MKKYLEIEVATPSEKSSFDQAKSCTAPGVLGQFQVLPGHTAMVSELGIGEVKIEFSDKTQCYAISGGFAEVLDSKVLLLLETAENAEDIDVARASEAKERAANRLKNRKSVDTARAEAALTRAVNRLKVAQRKSASA